MSQDALDQLKVDIAELITHASNTIDTLVQDAANKAAVAAAAIAAPAQPIVDQFTAQLIALSTDVRTATDKMKAQAAKVLGTIVGDVEAVGSTLVNDIKAAVQDVAQGVAGSTPPADTPAAAPAPADPVEAPVADPAPVSDAGQPADVTAVTIGPDSFKANA